MSSKIGNWKVLVSCLFEKVRNSVSEKRSYCDEPFQTKCRVVTTSIFITSFQLWRKKANVLFCWLYQQGRQEKPSDVRKTCETTLDWSHKNVDCLLPKQKRNPITYNTHQGWKKPTKKVTDLVRMGMSRPNSTHHNWPSTQRPIMYNKHKKGYLQRSLFDLAAINESMQRTGLFGRRMYYVNPFKRTI